MKIIDLNHRAIGAREQYKIQKITRFQQNIHDNKEL